MPNQPATSPRRKKAVLFGLLILGFWFIPQGFLLFSGLLVYLPYEQDGESRYLRLAGPVAQLWDDEAWAKDIPETCMKALVVAEDAHFFDHHGLEWSIFWPNVQAWFSGEKVSYGGSTITQQLVKNAFLSRERSGLRKGREAVAAVLLDLYMPKEWQLRWYLNIVEFGARIYGIEAAAQAYFQRTSQDLTPSQCISLVSLLPRPVARGRILKKKRLSPAMRRADRTIRRRLHQQAFLNQKDLQEADTFDAFGKRRFVPPPPDLPEVFRPKSFLPEASSPPPTLEFPLDSSLEP